MTLLQESHNQLDDALDVPIGHALVAWEVQRGLRRAFRSRERPPTMPEHLHPVERPVSECGVDAVVEEMARQLVTTLRLDPVEVIRHPDARGGLWWSPKPRDSPEPPGVSPGHPRPPAQEPRQA